MGLSVITWTPIEGHEGYSVSNTGTVKNSKGKLLYGSDKDGYVRVCVNYKLIRMHRLVAKAFVENQNNYSEVNHIDGNKKITTLQILNGVADHTTQSILLTLA